MKISILVMLIGTIGVISSVAGIYGLEPEKRNLILQSKIGDAPPRTFTPNKLKFKVWKESDGQRDIVHFISLNEFPVEIEGVVVNGGKGRCSVKNTPSEKIAFLHIEIPIQWRTMIVGLTSQVWVGKHFPFMIDNKECATPVEGRNFQFLKDGKTKTICVKTTPMEYGDRSSFIAACTSYVKNFDLHLNKGSVSYEFDQERN